MAKKKAKKTQPQQFLSPERFLKERMRSIPIGKCYVNNDYMEEGYGNVIVTRVHTGGNISFAVYLIDFWCVGVKHCIYKLRIDDFDFDDFVSRDDYHEISYNEAHNLVYGAIAFAEEAGVQPCKEFALAQYMLEEDTDDIPLIEYEFGKDGKYYFVANDGLEFSKYFPTLKKHLPEDQLIYTIMNGEDLDNDWYGDEDWDDDEDDWDDEEDDLDDEEEYTES